MRRQFTVASDKFLKFLAKCLNRLAHRGFFLLSHQQLLVVLGFLLRLLNTTRLTADITATNRNVSTQQSVQFSFILKQTDKPL